MSTTPPDDLRVALRPPRFRLATMFVAIAVFSVFLAISVTFGANVSLFLTVVGLAVLAHVAGNALGHRLRQSGSEPPVSTSEVGPTSHRARYSVAATDFAPATQLRERRALGWPNLLVTACGGIAAAVLGGTGLNRFYGEQITTVNLVLGMTGCLVLGAIWSFAAGSMLQVAFLAWRQSQREDRPHL